MPAPELSHAASFGLSSGVATPVHFIDEHEVLYPCGNTLVLHDMETKTQRFIPGRSYSSDATPLSSSQAGNSNNVSAKSENGNGFNAIAVSPNRRYVAVAEKAGGCGAANRIPVAISIYDIHKLKRVKVLELPREDTVNLCSEFTAVAFSSDSKHIVTQGNGPDWPLQYWCQWEKYLLTKKKYGLVPPLLFKARSPSATVKLSRGGDGGKINQILIKPDDAVTVAVVGEGIFRVFKYIEGALKQQPFQKPDPSINYMCLSWINKDLLAIGTSAGHILLYENTELKQDITVSNKDATKTLNEDVEAYSDIDDALAPVTSIAIYKKHGFVCGSSAGFVSIFDLNGSSYIPVFSLPTSSDNGARERGVDRDGVENNPSHDAVQHITLSPSGDLLVCTTGSNQLQRLSLATLEASGGSGIDADGNALCFKPVSSAFHQGSITGMDTCVRKPLLATCGSDSRIFIWDYIQDSLVLSKKFQEEAFSISLHPSGLFVLVGFSNKLRLMNVLMDDITTVKEFSIRGCRECKFSNGGHLFAAVQGNVVQIYSTFNMEFVGNLKGHNGKVRSIAWSEDDSKIVTCGAEGAIYEWDAKNLKRISEYVVKSCSFTSLVINPDSKSFYAVGSDQSLKQISVKEEDGERVAEEVVNLSSAARGASKVVLKQVALSRSGRMLFTASESGAMRAMVFPIKRDSEWIEHEAHMGVISRTIISHDDQFLFSAGEDGCIFKYKIIDKEGRGIKQNDIGFAGEVLVSASELVDLQGTVEELRKKVTELKKSNEFQLKLKEMHWQDTVKDITSSHEDALRERDMKISQLEEEKTKDMNKAKQEIITLSDEMEAARSDLQNQHEKKLMEEYENQRALETKATQKEEQYEKRLIEEQKAKEKALEDLAEFWDNKLLEKTAELDQALESNRDNMKDYQETKRQIEEDADRELLAIKNKYEERLAQEKQQTKDLKGKHGILNKQHESLKNEMKAKEMEQEDLHVEMRKQEARILTLQKDIASGKKEIEERDETIQDKEKRIYDLKKKNQELEKFKFVLDYKIKELKKQIEPKQKEISMMRDQIAEMDQELERYHNLNTKLNLNISNLKQKLKGTESRLKSEETKNSQLNNVCNRFRSDMQDAAKAVQNPKMLAEKFKDVYFRHVRDFNSQDVAVDESIQHEYNRQREYLERSVSSLRKKLQKSHQMHQSDNVRVVQENVTLIKEINDLRKELKISRQRVHALEVAITSGKQTNLLPNRLRAQEELDQTERIVEMQKDEIRRLRDQMQAIKINTPQASPARLPPMEMTT
eukprot:UC4_evm3s1043